MPGHGNCCQHSEADRLLGLCLNCGAMPGWPDPSWLFLIFALFFFGAQIVRAL